MSTEGRWFPAGSSMEEGDVNTPSAEAIIRQILYGNDWFRSEFGKASAEYMLPDCFGFPSSLPTILAHSGVKGFSTQKLVWGSSADGGGLQSLEKTPEGTPFNVGIWVGPDGESVLAGLNPGSYNGNIDTDLSAPLPAAPANPALTELDRKIADIRARQQRTKQAGQPVDVETTRRNSIACGGSKSALAKAQKESDLQKYQGDWAARVEQNGKISGLLTDYHYYGTGDTGGAPREDSVKRLEAIVTKGSVSLPTANAPRWAGATRICRGQSWRWAGACHLGDRGSDVSQYHSAEASSLPRYTGEMELTNHSAGSLTSQAYQKRWIRHQELLADAAEKSSIAAEWLGARTYPLQRLNDAWTLAMGAHFHDLAAGTATPGRMSSHGTTT